MYDNELKCNKWQFFYTSRWNVFTLLVNTIDQDQLGQNMLLRWLFLHQVGVVKSAKALLMTHYVVIFERLLTTCRKHAELIAFVEKVHIHCLEYFSHQWEGSRHCHISWTWGPFMSNARQLKHLGSSFWLSSPFLTISPQYYLCETIHDMNMRQGSDMWCYLLGSFHNPEHQRF